MPKVSVIMPVYNAANTLNMSLSCLVQQTLRDIEIILVNDCSTDASAKILEGCEQRYPDKVMLIHLSENHGAGGARNIGLAYASGEYIGFMDSDDTAVPDMFEKMYLKAVEGGYDIVDCGYYNEETDKAMVHTADELCGELNGYKRNELIASGGYLWSRIFKKSLLDSVPLTFREHCILEDCETLMLLLAKAKSIGNVKEILYCYKNNNNSISKFHDTDSYYQNAAAAIRAIYGTMSPLPDYPEYQHAVEYAICQLCSFAANSCLAKENTSPASIREKRLAEIRGFLKDMVRLPIADNRFIQNKVKKEDVLLLKNLIKYGRV